MEWVTADVIVSYISPDILFEYQYGELPYIGKRLFEDYSSR